MSNEGMTGRSMITDGEGTIEGIKANKTIQLVSPSPDSPTEKATP